MDIQERCSLEEVCNRASRTLEEAARQIQVDYSQIQEVARQLSLAAQIAAEAAGTLANALAEAVTSWYQSASPTLMNLTAEMFWMVPPRIKHLAHNHPKARVRNKNWNRMWRIYERYKECHKQ